MLKLPPNFHNASAALPGEFRATFLAFARRGSARPESRVRSREHARLRILSGIREMAWVEEIAAAQPAAIVALTLHGN
eukprot:3628952-Alexandrium_andersonii.AAC.1